jgi:phosphatidylserine/phosphatidylglycerophosphate/cardiolipin synthase-like enzyme
MPVAASQHFFPFEDRKVFAGTKVKFVLDGKLPVGACHHQKMIVVDDAIGFCGGGDIGPDRWDTPKHLDDDSRREKTRRDNKDFDSRQEVMGLVDGEAAKMLGALFRDRWARCTGEALEPAPPMPKPHWPGNVPPQFTDVPVGLSRTSAAWRRYPEVRETEALHVRAIAEAKACIYMENQYFTSPLIARELARRLVEPDGPEVVLVSTEHSPSYFDRASMDKTRLNFIRTLKAADKHERMRIYSPVTTLGRTIIVHAKLTIIDDVLLRIGSANINNRSMGFDSECDVAVEADSNRPGHDDVRRQITSVRDQLVAEHLGVSAGEFAGAMGEHGSFLKTIEALRGQGKTLRPITERTVSADASRVAESDLVDPDRVPPSLARSVQRFIAGLRG